MPSIAVIFNRQGGEVEKSDITRLIHYCEAGSDYSIDTTIAHDIAFATKTNSRLLDNCSCGIPILCAKKKTGLYLTVS